MNGHVTRKALSRVEAARTKGTLIDWPRIWEDGFLAFARHGSASARHGSTSVTTSKEPRRKLAAHGRRSPGIRLVWKGHRARCLCLGRELVWSGLEWHRISRRAHRAVRGWRLRCQLRHLWLESEAPGKYLISPEGSRCNGELQLSIERKHERHAQLIQNTGGKSRRFASKESDSSA